MATGQDGVRRRMKMVGEEEDGIKQSPRSLQHGQQWPMRNASAALHVGSIEGLLSLRARLASYQAKGRGDGGRGRGRARRGWKMEIFRHPSPPNALDAAPTSHHILQQRLHRHCLHRQPCPRASSSSTVVMPSEPGDSKLQRWSEHWYQYTTPSYESAAHTEISTQRRHPRRGQNPRRAHYACRAATLNEA
ncbi:hypothetical protein BDY17DRAFT_49854 [Neohortaea acidophila]|uniref:Uncharacterized protein n=1 Tax=Neohortaea acidophila TaxID=245834 RepID=A0A6A6PGK7_9PEZI|nr:uncharacterized protein BDY17DRAFT_49854 [Neohortaea acidophila]KAF2479109.1 hypothetical protein BDY17DRAFT_49854 [Neohortaea acidophila]